MIYEVKYGSSGIMHLLKVKYEQVINVHINFILKFHLIRMGNSCCGCVEVKRNYHLIFNALCILIHFLLPPNISVFFTIKVNFVILKKFPEKEIKEWNGKPKN